MSSLPPSVKVALLWLLRLGVGGLFLVTGALKIMNPREFAVQIHNYQLFTQLSPWLAATLPAVEIAVGAALLAGPRAWVRAGALASGTLMAMFTVAVISAVARGISISCGCFGSASDTITWITVARDVGLLAACAGLFLLADEPPGSAPVAAPAA